jgi:hypothetical protein
MPWRAPGSRFAWFVAGRYPDLRLWRSDGTVAGTQPVVGTSVPFGEFRVIGGQVIFASDTEETGQELFRFDPGATVQPLGRACGASLAGTDPVLGGVARLCGSVSRANGAAALLIGVLAARPTLVEPGCGLHFDFGAPLIAFGFAVSGTTWSGQIAMPATPSLTGSSIAVQCLAAPGSTRLGLDLSNGLLWAPGR